MKRKIVVFCFAILLTILPCVVFVGCNDTKKDEQEKSEEPWSREYIEKMIRSKFFDEDGEAISHYWEESNKVAVGIKDFQMPEITGFEIYFLKDAQTKEEDWFLVEFEPIGHYVGCRCYSKHKYDMLGGAWPTYKWEFSGIPSYVKLLGIPYEEVYCRSMFLCIQVDNAHYKYISGEEKTGPLFIELGPGLDYLIPGIAYSDFVLKYGASWVDAERDAVRIYNPEKRSMEDVFVYRPTYGKYDPLKDHIDEIRQSLDEMVAEGIHIRK